MEQRADCRADEINKLQNLSKAVSEFEENFQASLEVRRKGFSSGPGMCWGFPDGMYGVNHLINLQSTVNGTSAAKLDQQLAKFGCTIYDWPQYGSTGGGDLCTKMTLNVQPDQRNNHIPGCKTARDIAHWVAVNNPPLLPDVLAWPFHTRAVQPHVTKVRNILDRVRKLDVHSVLLSRDNELQANAEVLRHACESTFTAAAVWGAKFFDNASSKEL